MKSEAGSLKMETTKVADGLMKVKLPSGKGLLKVVLEKKDDDANCVYLEISGVRNFEAGNDCDTCHFWFKCLREPRLGGNRKIMNLPKTIQMPRPVDETLIREISPLFELLEKGEYYVFETSISLTGPYGSEDEGSYFFSDEFHELWDISDPVEEDLLSGWEHFEGERPRIYRHGEGSFVEKQFDFVIPLVKQASLSEENVKLYRSMIAEGDRPRILLLGMYQRGIPETVRRNQTRTMHSFFAGFVLDGHHKLAAYRRSRVPAKFLVILAQKASKFHLRKDETGPARAHLESRLTTLVG
ncbi:MAG: hypothetical protein HY924_13730 [Elusimicrobia bacterium]|nr:hypothetical protein [Elusimicrobiota bacterium]